MAAKDPETLREFLLDGLRNAHAMESQAVTLTAAQADRLEHYPFLEKRIRDHQHESEEQRRRLEELLERMGTSPSMLKDFGLKMSGNLAALAHIAAPDEVIKNTFASFAFEHFEIIAYKALIEAAQMAGDSEVARVCRQNLAEEEAMAKWIDENLAELIHKFIGRTSSGATAKV